LFHRRLCIRISHRPPLLPAIYLFIYYFIQAIHGDRMSRPYIGT